jgi:hypothetical protein
LRQALVAWDMLSKAATVCPKLAKEAPRLEEIQKVAQARLHVSAKALHGAMAFETPPVFMTDRQAAGVVANAKGCDTAAMAQWQGGARWVVDTSVQVIEGEAPADLAWPAQAALEKPLRITVAGQQRYGDTRTVLLQLSNDSAAPARVALLGQQLFVGLCTKVGAEGVPVWPNYAPSQWLTIPPRFKAPVSLVLDGSCKPQPRVNVGGAIAVDMGQGVRYRRFLIRGVGQAPAPSITIPPAPPAAPSPAAVTPSRPPAASSPPTATPSPTPPPASYNWLRERPVPAPPQR